MYYLPSLWGKCHVFAACVLVFFIFFRVRTMQHKDLDSSKLQNIFKTMRKKSNYISAGTRCCGGVCKKRVYFDNRLLALEQTEHYTYYLYTQYKKGFYKTRKIARPFIKLYFITILYLNVCVSMHIRRKRVRKYNKGVQFQLCKCLQSIFFFV